MRTTMLKPRQSPHAVRMHHNSDWTGYVTFRLAAVFDDDDRSEARLTWHLPGFIVEAIRDGAVEEFQEQSNASRTRPLVPTARERR